MIRWLVSSLLALAASSACAVPSFDEVRRAHRPSDITLQDRHGQPLQTLRLDASVRRGPWLALDEMSPALLQAIVLSEDQRFWQHSGVDWAAAARSAFANLWNTRTRGASTLTMQLAGLLDADLARPGAGRSVAQKIGQATLALQLEQRWSKSQILEAYLNQVPLRGELVGVNAMAQTLFGKHASGLDAQEAAVIAALARAPNAPADTVAQRACAVLRAQTRACTGVQTFTANALTRRPGALLGPALAPHFARHWLATRGQQASTTLDATTQRVAARALHQQLTELAGRNVQDGAVLVLDNASGEVLAWVGSSGELSDAAAVDGVLARRLPGSTLKPFIYTLAFEQRLITPASLLDDSPTQVGTSAGLYLPQNYDRQFKGWVSARAALGASLNVPAVRVAALLGMEAVHERLNAHGLKLAQPAAHYGQALALGGAEVTLLDLTNAYRSLANGGRFAAVGTAPKTRVASAAAVALTSDILADNNARALGFGLDSVLASSGHAAVKTGTSKDMRDNWCIGYTERYTVGVWVGNADGEPMHGVSGVSGAAPVWQAMVRHLHQAQPSRAPAWPAGVERQRVRNANGREPARDELFIAGTWRSAAANSAAATDPIAITNPRPGSVFALDPDMPAAVQRIVFSGESGTWVLNGRRLGSGTRLPWAPQPGRHSLKLLGAEGQLVQELHFEVRAPRRVPGATMKHLTAKST